MELLRGGRRQEFEILKGILIVCIVVGHTISTPFINVFWFHVPAFFMLTGYFINTPSCHPFASKEQWIKKVRRYVVPYFTYSAVLFILFRQEPLFKNLIRTLYAGYNNVSLYSYPFWFINTLFISSIIFEELLFCMTTLKNKYISSRVYMFLIFLSLWIMIHINDIYPFKYPLPWGIDQSLGALVYIYVGYIMKNFTWNRIIIIFPLITLSFIFLHQINASIDCTLNMCPMHYDDFLLDLLIPISFTITLYIVSMGIKLIPYLNRVLCLVGESTFTIFFTHAALIAIWPWKQSVFSVLFITIIGCVFHYLFTKWKLTKELFIGKRVLLK